MFFLSCRTWSEIGPVLELMSPTESQLIIPFTFQNAPLSNIKAFDSTIILWHCVSLNCLQVLNKDSVSWSLQVYRSFTAPAQSFAFRHKARGIRHDGPDLRSKGATDRPRLHSRRLYSPPQISLVVTY